MVNHVCSVISDEHCIQKQVHSSYPGCANEWNKSSTGFFAWENVKSLLSIWASIWTLLRASIAGCAAKKKLG